MATERERIVEAFIAALRDMTEAIKTHGTALEAAAAAASPNDSRANPVT